MREWVRAGGAAILIGGPTVLAFFSGGFFDSARLIAGVVAWLLVILVTLTERRIFPSSATGRSALAGLALLCAWSVLSVSWAPLAGRAQDDFQRLLLYLGFFWAAIFLLRSPWVRRALEPAVALGSLVVVLYGLADRLLPGLFEFDRSRTAAGRLEQPITYWNAMGLAASLGLVLCMRLAGDPDRSRPLRAGAAACGVPLGLGAYLSFSRGALAAVAVGVVMLLALAPNGRPQLRSVALVLIASVLAALVSERLSAVRSLDLGDKGDAGQGAIMLGALIVLSGAAAAAQLIAAQRWEAGPVRAAAPAYRRVAVMGSALALLAVGAVFVGAFEGRPSSVSPGRGADPARLKSVDTNRYSYWEVALEMAGKQPLAGAGAGSFGVEWLKQEERVDRANDAHSLYIETLAELGLVGLAMLGLFLGGVAAAARRLMRTQPAAATGLVAGCAAWAVHAGLDWDWEMPAVTLPALLLAAALVCWSERRPAGNAEREAAEADELPPGPRPKPSAISSRLRSQGEPV